VFKYPTKMSFLKGAEEIAMGLHFGLLSREGQVMVWGSNRWGELGDGDESRDFAVEAEERCELELTGLAAGSNYVVGFRNYKNE
jgi:alpha-tubulin suppressor-like RCC1 family protein